MRIIVTGGAGFIGSHLCETLLEEGHEVWCIDDLSTGRKQNIEHLFENGRFHFVHHDVRDPFGQSGIDRVYHLACPASPKAYMADPLRTIETCYKGTLNALRFGKRVLLASTSEVYGDPKLHPQPESYFGNVNTWGPRACYDEGKRIAETVCYNHKEFTEVRVARIFNTYGPRMDCSDGRVIPEFITSAMCGTPLLVHGGGKQTRSFCYVRDTVRGLMMLMESGVDSPVNIGNPYEIEIQGLAIMISLMCGRKNGEMRTVKARPDDPSRRRPDIRKAKDLLGWYPLIGLDEGLRYTIEYFQRRTNQVVMAR